MVSTSATSIGRYENNRSTKDNNNENMMDNTNDSDKTHDENYHVEVGGLHQFYMTMGRIDHDFPFHSNSLTSSELLINQLSTIECLQDTMHQHTREWNSLSSNMNTFEMLSKRSQRSKWLQLQTLCQQLDCFIQSVPAILSKLMQPYTSNSINIDLVFQPDVALLFNTIASSFKEMNEHLSTLDWIKWARSNQLQDDHLGMGENLSNIKSMYAKYCSVYENIVELDQKLKQLAHLT